jgi:hypothetical protein
MLLILVDCILFLGFTVIFHMRLLEIRNLIGLLVRFRSYILLFPYSSKMIINIYIFYAW